MMLARAARRPQLLVQRAAPSMARRAISLGAALAPRRIARGAREGGGLLAADGAAASCCSDVMKAATCSSALSVRLLPSSAEEPVSAADESAVADGARAAVRFIRARGRVHKRGADASVLLCAGRGANKFPRSRELAGAAT